MMKSYHSILRSKHTMNCSRPLACRVAAMVLPAVLSVWCQAASPRASTAEQFHVDYTVAVASTEQQLFHVTASVKNINQDSLDLALPVWTPGWYTIENYFKNVLRFSVTDSGGKRIQPM